MRTPRKLGYFIRLVVPRALQHRERERSSICKDGYSMGVTVAPSITMLGWF